MGLGPELAPAHLAFLSATSEGYMEGSAPRGQDGEAAGAVFPPRGSSLVLQSSTGSGTLAGQRAGGCCDREAARWSRAQSGPLWSKGHGRIAPDPCTRDFMLGALRLKHRAARLCPEAALPAEQRPLPVPGADSGSPTDRAGTRFPGAQEGCRLSCARPTAGASPGEERAGRLVPGLQTARPVSARLEKPALGLNSEVLLFQPPGAINCLSPENGPIKIQVSGEGDHEKGAGPS